MLRRNYIRELKKRDEKHNLELKKIIRRMEIDKIVKESKMKKETKIYKKCSKFVLIKPAKGLLLNYTDRFPDIMYSNSYKYDILLLTEKLLLESNVELELFDCDNCKIKNAVEISKIKTVKINEIYKNEIRFKFNVKLSKIKDKTYNLRASIYSSDKKHNFFKSDEFKLFSRRKEPIEWNSWEYKAGIQHEVLKIK